MTEPKEKRYREFWIRIPTACDMTEPHHITNVGIKNFWEDQKTIHVIEHRAFSDLLDDATFLADKLDCVAGLRTNAAAEFKAKWGKYGRP